MPAHVGALVHGVGLEPAMASLGDFPVEVERHVGQGWDPLTAERNFGIALGQSDRHIVTAIMHFYRVARAARGCTHLPSSLRSAPAAAAGGPRVIRGLSTMADSYAPTEALKQAVRGHEAAVLSGARDRVAGRRAAHLLPLSRSRGSEPVLALGRAQGQGLLHLHRASGGTRSSTSSCAARASTSRPPSCGSPRSSAAMT